MTRTYFTSSKSEPTLGWERLPIVGDDRRDYRERVWRRVSIGLTAFLGTVTVIAWMLANR